jgi:hypothetical protein
MGTGLLGVRHQGVKQLALREENGFFDSDLLNILIRRHVANPTIKGRNAAKNSPTKKFLIVYSFLSDAEIRCYRRKISPGGRRFFCLPSACAILLSAGFDIL